MLVLLHYDAVYNPVANNSMNNARQREYLTYLDGHPYEKFADHELAEVCSFYL